MRLRLGYVQLISDASHAGHEDLTSHAACDFFLVGPNSRGHVEGHSARLKRKLGASSEAEAAGLLQCAKRSAVLLDAIDGLSGYTVPIEVLLDAQVVIRQVAFGADGKVLASFRRFHGLDLGQLHDWAVKNRVTIGWLAGKNECFTTDAKTKSKPDKTGLDNPKHNRWFLLKALDLEGEESERFDANLPSTPQN